MSLRIEASSSGVPEGQYQAELTAVEPFNENADKYGEAFRFVWEITEGDFEGDESSRICARKLTKKSALGKLVRSLKGSDVEKGESVDLESFIGLTGLIIVEELDSGSTRVAKFLPAK